VPVRALIAAAAAAFLLLSACSAREVLVPRSKTVPAGIDLTGLWRLQTEGSNEKLSDAEWRAANDGGIAIPSASRERRSQPRASRDSLVHVFLETGAMLKITQTEHGLFISFDRAIVEEYRYGENRVVNVGPVEADRVSGWDGGDYVIETLDMEGNKLVERYALQGDGTALVRRVSIFRKGELDLSVVQRYERT